MGGAAGSAGRREEGAPGGAAPGGGSPGGGSLAGGLSEADNRRLLDRQTALLEMLATGEPLEAVLTTVVTSLEALIAGARCSILLLDPVTATLYHGAAPTLPASYAAAIDGMSIGPDEGSCGACAYLGVPVVAEDIAQDERWEKFRHLALPHGLRSCWSTPIRGRTGTTGTFAVYHDEAHRPAARERWLVERFTHLASLAIDHALVFGALTESEERFRRAFEDSAAGMALTDLHGRFVRVNLALREMLRRSEAELLASSTDEVLSATIAGPDPAQLLAEVVAGRQERAQFEADALRSDGRVQRVAVAASAVRAADGSPVHLCLNLQDVTQRHAAERERRARREAEVARSVAEAASQAKSRFLSSLGHELRTPLQVVAGFAEVLGTLELSPERRDAALAHILDATAHITALVDDVLDIAKIEAGALTLRVTDVRLDEAVPRVLSLLAPLAAEHAITLAHQGAGGVVRADERRLRQVLINLVTNAIRYNSPRGHVEVAAAPREETVAIRVSDTGPGIPDVLLSRLFVPFDRLGTGSGPEHGAGLGLPLARGLARAMGGELTLESRPGAGTTATVLLPAARGLPSPTWDACRRSGGWLP